MTLQSLYKNGSSNQIPIPIKKKKKKWTQIPLIFYITLGMWFCGRINYSSTLRNPASLSNCASWKGWQLSWKFRSHIRSVCRMEMRHIVRTAPSILSYRDINVSRQWSTIFNISFSVAPADLSSWTPGYLTTARYLKTHGLNTEEEEEKRQDNEYNRQETSYQTLKSAELTSVIPFHL